ncbi:hypothetical protein FOF52_06960 [Thermobifida alba]|uniref:Transcriptional regulator n=1 Tax=Thermobifida alba TaxID=53522 RepID=A0ABY4KZ71_THEAE|nr:hypothetical protein [Thermobifida alba]UPT20726.1 hypothetical protein FOF52_06960 [Thermobifida alba]HLU98314.1 hypothetical protein [Thermobifida alba]
MTVPTSSLRPLLGLPSRWSQRPLRHTETLRLTETTDAVGHAVTHAHSLCPSPATPAIVARLHRGPAVLAELAAETGLPLGLVAKVCQDLAEAGMVGIDLDHDRSGARKVVVVAATLEQERAFVAALTGDRGALLCMDYPVDPYTPVTVELTVSRAVRRPDWPVPLCLMGSPRDVDNAALWREALRDAAALVLLLGPDCEQAVGNVLAHAPDRSGRVAAVAFPHAPEQVRSRLREAGVLSGPDGIWSAADPRLPEAVARIAATRG